MENQKQRMKDYWRRNIKIVLSLIAVWFIVSFGFGILLVDQLNAFRLGGFKLGFGLPSRDPFTLLLF